MKRYQVKLQSSIENNFYTMSACNSVDLDISKPYTHQLEVEVDLDTPWNILFINGPSGSGKSSLAREMFGVKSFKTYLNPERPLISQFPDKMSYNDRIDYLTASGISSVPQWVIPAKVLSNGQQARAEIALALAHTHENEVICLEEFSSVLDRSIAKILAHSVQKFIRLKNRKAVFIACHNDLLEFLNPDHVIHCESSVYEDRRELLRQPRNEKFTFEMRRVDKSTWKNFSQYHYLSRNIPGGLIFCYGLFYQGSQIGIHIIANYVPIRKGQIPILHGARIVIRPDFVGLGLGLSLVNESVKHLNSTMKCRIRTSSSSIPMYRAMLKDPHWKLVSSENIIGKAFSTKMRKNLHDTQIFSRLKKPESFRGDCKVFKFEWIGR